MSNKNVFVILTNKHSLDVLIHIQKIVKSINGIGDSYVLYHQTFLPIPEGILNLKHHAFTTEILTSLNYKPISKRLIPGNCHFPLLDFFMKYPEYDYYWFIEDDVLFTGNFEYLSDHLDRQQGMTDFACCHIRTYQEEPDWFWWDSLKHEDKWIPLSIRIRSFNPFFRISRNALRDIHFAHIDGWQGHNEVLIPTLLFLRGYNILDIGGKGKFVPIEMKNLHYEDSLPNVSGDLSSGTMRYRPLITESEIKDKMLYHPFKIHH